MPLSPVAAWCSRTADAPDQRLISWRFTTEQQRPPFCDLVVPGYRNCFARSLRVVFNWVSFYVGLQAFKAKQRPQRGLLFLKTATPKVAPGKHFFDGLTSWNGQEGGDLDTFTKARRDPARQTITSRSRLPRNVQNILPPIRGSLPEVIRSWCAHHHHHHHHHTRSSPAV